MAYYRIVYTTRTRTTALIAERLAVRLRSMGQRAIACTLATSPESELDERLIIASPINGMKVLPEFRFYCQELARSQIPVFGLFLVSYIAPTGRALWRNMVHRELDRMSAITRAREKAIFPGRIDKPMPPLARFLFGLKKNLPIDQRDDTLVDAWADSLLKIDSPAQV